MSFKDVLLQRFSALQFASKRQGQTPNRASTEHRCIIYINIYYTAFLKRRESGDFFGLNFDGALQK